MTRQRHGLFYVFSSLIVIAVLWIYGHSPLRAKIENLWFDLRTRVAAHLRTPPVDVPAVIDISENSMDALAPPQLPASESLSNAPRNVSVDSLARLARSALRCNPKELNLVLYPNLITYDNPGISGLVSMAIVDKRISFTTFGLADPESMQVFIPNLLAGIETQLYFGDLFLEYRRNIIREWPLAFNIRASDSLVRFAPAALAGVTVDDAAARDKMGALLRKDESGEHFMMRLNYFNPDALVHIAAEAIDQPSECKKLENRTAIVGYTTYRAWSMQPTLVNTPMQFDGGELNAATPFTWVLAIAVSNLMNDRNLHDVPIAVPIIQAIVVGAVSLLVWRLGTGIAVVIYALVWTILWLIHAFLFARFAVFVPLADTTLLSAICVTLGGLWRLSLDVKSRASREIAIATKKEVAELQGRFLSRFSLTLQSINKEIQAEISPQPELADSVARTGWHRAVAASEELREYLDGIIQLALLEPEPKSVTRRTRVQLKAVSERVIRRIDNLISQRQIKIKIDIPEDLRAVADESLLDQIIYNLLSNAIKYSPPQSTVHIEATGQWHKVIWTITDQGPGIPTELAERVFEKFYRIRDERLYQAKGHGLGLFLSRFFAEKMGAQIDIVSLREETQDKRLDQMNQTGTIGPGATFKVTLRRAR